MENQYQIYRKDGLCPYAERETCKHYRSNLKNKIVLEHSSTCNKTIEMYHEQMMQQ